MVRLRELPEEVSISGFIGSLNFDMKSSVCRTEVHSCRNISVNGLALFCVGIIAFTFAGKATSW